MIPRRCALGRARRAARRPRAAVEHHRLGPWRLIPCPSCAGQATAALWAAVDGRTMLVQERLVHAQCECGWHRTRRAR